LVFERLKDLWSQKRRRKKFKKRMDHLEETLSFDNTEQRSIADIIRDYEPRNPEFAGLMRLMYSQGWPQDSIFGARHSWDKHISRRKLRLGEEVMSFLHEAVVYGSMTQDYRIEEYTHDQQFDMVIGAIGRAIEAGVHMDVFDRVWGRWQGNENPQNDSRKFAEDLQESIKGLENYGYLSRRMRTLFTNKMDRLTESKRISYGARTREICSCLMEDSEYPTADAAYGLCGTFHDLDVNEELPRMYRSFLRLPQHTPTNIISFVSQAIRYIRSSSGGIENMDYADSVQKLVYKISFLLRGNQSELEVCGDAEDTLEIRLKQSPVRQYLPGDIASLFPVLFNADEADQIVAGYSRLLDEIIGSDGTGRGFSLDNVRRMMPVLQGARFDADRTILECTTRLREFNQFEASYFENMLDPLKGPESPFSFLHLIVFADTHLKICHGQGVAPVEQRLYDEMVTYASLAQTARLDDSARLIQIVNGDGNWKRVPKHVAAFYAGMGIQVPNIMLDIGRDNEAWYKCAESAEGYLHANRGQAGAARIDRDLISNIGTHMMQTTGAVQNRYLALHGLACGDAWPELILKEMLQNWFTDGRHQENYDVQLSLYDVNDAMIRRAALNCNSRRILLPQTRISRKDIRNINYDDLGMMSGRQLILTMFGRTYFNLETESNPLLDSLADISMRHYHEGNKSPTIILIEGAKQSDMIYYRDEGAERMHVQYFLSRLDAEKRTVCYDASMSQSVPTTPLGRPASSTYAAIQTPNKDRVEFYFAALDDVSILGGRFNLARHQLVRVGESRVVSGELIDEFSSAGFDVSTIDNGGNSVILQLLPDYHMLDAVTGRCKR